MSLRVMAGFAAGATLAGMVVGVARLADVVDPSTAVAEPPAAVTAPPPAEKADSSPTEPTPPRWHAPKGAPEEVTAGVLARVASQAEASRCESGPEPERKPVAAKRRAAGKDARRAPKAAHQPRPRVA